jgi:hypothetical protein
MPSRPSPPALPNQRVEDKHDDTLNPNDAYAQLPKFPPSSPSRSERGQPSMGPSVTSLALNYDAEQGRWHMPESSESFKTSSKTKSEQDVGIRALPNGGAVSKVWKPLHQ